MDLGVTEFAISQGISPRRVLQLIEQGRVAARRTGGLWLIDSRELRRRSFIRRPMSRKMAWAFIGLLSGGAMDPDLDPAETSRLRSRLREVAEHEDPARLLSSWLHSRCPVAKFAVSRDDGPRFAADARFVLSGISDPRARLSSSGEFEGYVMGNDLAALTQDFLLVPSSQPNVLLHVVDHAIGSPAPLGLVIADLADRNSPREDAQVARLLGRE